MLHALPLSAAADAVFTLSDRTEARARAPDPITNALALDLDTLIDARAVWTEPRATYTLAELPRFTALDYNGPAAQAAVLDSVLALAEWRWRQAALRVAEAASYGQESFESLSALPNPGTPQPATNSSGSPAPLPAATLVPPTSKSVLYASSVTTLGSTLKLRPWTVLTTVGYELSGGANSAARDVLPFQKGPFATATADYKVGTHDHLITAASGTEASFSTGGEVTAVSGSEASFSTGTEDAVLQIEEQWRRQWAPLTETTLGAGAYATRTRAALGAADTYSSGPAALAAVDQRLVRRGSHWQFRAEARLAPIINLLNGLADEQIQGTIIGSWTRRRSSLRALVSAGESVHQGTAISSKEVSAEFDAAYKASAWLTFDAGVRALYQEQDELVVPAGGQGAVVQQGALGQGLVFFAVTVRAVKARF
jgi:hypothetical protein